MELMVALSLSAVALAAAWPWLWNAADVARAADARAQAATSAAFATRSIAADLKCATALLAPPAGASPERCLQLTHTHPGQTRETILIAWNTARRVLWRKTTATYLADNVESFTITYFDHQGAPWGRSTWPSRRGLTVSPECASGSASQRRWDSPVPLATWYYAPDERPPARRRLRSSCGIGDRRSGGHVRSALHRRRLRAAGDIRRGPSGSHRHGGDQRGTRRRL